MERPIIFNTEMVQAILEGRKTQTRRVIKPQPIYDNSVWTHPDIDDFWLDSESMAVGILESDDVECPYGYAYADGTGDLLYVRETWRHKAHNFPIGLPYEYKSTAEIDGVPLDEPWRPSVHMPKEASRIWLRVKDVRVEQVQDISEEDAVEEGVCAIEGFAQYWDSIYAKQGYGWEANPWVWVIEFEDISTNGRVKQ